MKFVLDSSVLAKLFFVEPGSDVTADLIEEGYQGGVEFLASELTIYEVGNTISKHFRKRKGDGQEHMRQLLQLELTYIRLDDKLAPRATKLAHEHDITYYDSVHVAVAKDHRAPLVTEDSKLLDKFDSSITTKVALRRVKRLT